MNATMLSVLMKKELKTYFVLPIAYVFLTVYLVVNSWMFFNGFFIIGQADMRPFFSLQPMFFLFFIPAVTMRLWSEEKGKGTYQYLMTLPAGEWIFVGGKYLAALIFMAIALAGTFTIPLTVSYMGNPDWGVIIASYLGALLMAGSYLAIGSFASSITDNQIVAYILGVVLCFLIWVTGEQFVIFTLPSFLANIFEFIGLGARFRSIQRGVIDLRDIVYYCSVIAFFLYANKIVLESRKWE